MVEGVIALVQEKLAIEDKKNQLEHVLGIRLGDMDDALRHFMLRDYLRSSHGTQTTLSDIQQRFGVLKRVRKILSGCPHAHPGAVFDFCVAYPEHGLSEFLDLQERCSLVFYNEGDRIRSFLSETDMAKLQKLSLKEALDRPRMSAAQAMIRWHLDFRGVNDPDYLKIFANGHDAPYQCLILERGKRIEPDAYLMQF